VATLKHINDEIEKIAGALLVFFMVIFAIVIPVAVFTRYVVKIGFTWSDEISLFSLVWASMLGAAIGLRKGYQIGIRYFVDKSPRILSIILEAISYLFILGFLTVLVIFGTKQTIINARQLSAAIRIPMAIPYAALPVGFAIMILFTIEQILDFIGRINKKNDIDSEEKSAPHKESYIAEED